MVEIPPPFMEISQIFIIYSFCLMFTPTSPFLQVRQLPINLCPSHRGKRKQFLLSLQQIFTPLVSVIFFFFLAEATQFFQKGSIFQSVECFHALHLMPFRWPTSFSNTLPRISGEKRCLCVASWTDYFTGLLCATPLFTQPTIIFIFLQSCDNVDSSSVCEPW